MGRQSLSPIVTILGLFAMSQIMGEEVLASKPNIVLSQAIHFTTPRGESVTVNPGKYFVEQVGGTHLRFKSEDGSTVIDVQGKSFSHEQYELFSAMAVTRPGEEDLIYVDLLLPGGLRIEATGSTSSLSGMMPAGP